MTVSASAAAVTTTWSPFSLLRDETEAEQVLILTYTANLDFFERFALGEARGLQAATTIISDATMVAADPVTVRGAGVRYVDARAVCPANTAFHPKLLAIVSADRATVAIGSGNLTLAGWHGNAELWTVLRADREHGPHTIRGVSRFLRTLGDGRIQISAEASGALDRVTELLDGLTADEPGPRLVSTLDSEPIMNRLPIGPVDELIVYSPYYDAELKALDALVERMSPKHLTVFVQPQTSVDGPRLAHWLGQHRGQLRWCTPDRFRHGKLIEWSRDGVREALTGSPNLSRPAVMNTLRSGPEQPAWLRANCELGLIGRIEGSLAPAETPVPGAGIAGLKFQRDAHEQASRPVTVLLGATLIDQVEVHLRLASPLDQPARIQVHHADRDWTTAPGHAELQSGHADYRVASFGLPAGTALRLLGSGGASNEVFVVDPLRARGRPYKRVGPDAGSHHHLILDGRLDVLFQIAALMRPQLLKLGAHVLNPAAGTADDSADDASSEKTSPKPGQTLEEYLGKCATVLDEKEVVWALAIPALPSLGGGTRIDRQSGALTNEIDDGAADAGADEDGDRDDKQDPLDAARKATALRRRQWRQFCEKALTMAAAWPLIMRAYLARLTLNGVAVDLWPDEAQKGEILKRLVAAIAGPGDDPTAEEAAALASYAAIAIALLREQIHRMSITDEATLRYRAAAKSAAPIIHEIDPVRIEDIVVEIAEAFGQVLTGEDVFEIAAQAESPPTGIAAAIKLLCDEDDTEATEEDGALVLTKPITGMFQRELLRAAGLVDGVKLVTVRGRFPNGGEALCVWDPPLLLLASRLPAGLNGRVYALPAGVTPKVISQGWKMTIDVHENLPRPVEDWYPGVTIPSLATELLASAGVTT